MTTNLTCFDLCRNLRLGTLEWSFDRRKNSFVGTGPGVRYDFGVRGAACLGLLALLLGCNEARKPAPVLGKARPVPERLPDAIPRGTYLPNVPELTRVGPIGDRVERGSTRFGQLVQCQASHIVFKDEERTGADRVMTARLRAQLLRLGVLVTQEWPTLRLRVTEAWDENQEHGARSLHYEGRAADLTLSDRDTRKLGRLAGLAIQAGFDWVAHEPTHVHASVRR